MAINYHPNTGTVLICDFKDFREPEMTKRRPAVVVSPRLRARTGLCTVVPLSTTPPKAAMPYHFKLHISPPLPKPYDSRFHWVKADMLYTVSFERLFIPHSGKDKDTGKRLLVVHEIDEQDLRAIRACILHALGMSPLTAHL